MSKDRSHSRAGVYPTHNLSQSLTLLASLGTVAGISAYLLAGVTGVAAVAVLVIAVAVSAPHLSAETLMRFYTARLVPADDSQLSSLVDVLAWRAGLTHRPDLYLIPSLTLNAFAAGTAEKPAIAVSEGLVRRLTLRELAGVLAHEMSHIRNGDLWIMGLADVAARVVQSFSYCAFVLAVFNAIAYVCGGEMVSWVAIALMYLTPAIINVIQLALSRAREFEADRLAAAITGDPLALASALRRVETYTGHFWEDLTPPVPARRVPQPSLLRTHPPADQRVARLVALGGTASPDPLVIVERPMMSLVGMGPASLRPRYRWSGLWY
jgi:heat shock protein HtpX